MSLCQKGGKDNECTDDDEDDSKDAVAESILRDFNYKLRCMMMERNRKLTVTWTNYNCTKISENILQ